METSTNKGNDVSSSTVIPSGAQNSITLALWASRNYYVEDFLVPAEAGVVCAATFNRALAYLVSIGGGVLHLLDKVYDVTDQPVTLSGQNAVIPLPYVAINSQNIVIKISGSTNIQAFSPPVPNKGSVIYCGSSGSVSSGIRSSVIGYGSASHSAILWSALTVELENITVRVEVGSGMVPIDLYAVSNAILNNVTASINADPGSIPQSTDPDFVGIKLPASGNFGVVKVQKTYITGFYDGMWFAEHADVDVLIQNCVYALHAPDSWSHLVVFRQVTTQGCSYSVRSSAIPGDAYTNSVCGYISIERDPQFPFMDDFYVDAGCELRGMLSYVVAAAPESGISSSGPGEFQLVARSIPLSQYEQGVFIEETSEDISLNPKAWFTIIVPQALTRAINISLADGQNVGQRIRVYSYYAEAVSLVTIASMYFPDNSSSNSYTMSGGSGSVSYIELLWDSNSWLVNVVGNAVTQTLRTLGYTVGSLPTGSQGMRAYVTDAASPSFLSVLVGGGSTVCPAFYNGTSWVAG